MLPLTGTPVADSTGGRPDLTWAGLDEQLKRISAGG